MVMEAAGISRATAYRYFPIKDILLAEVAPVATGGPLLSAKPVEGMPIPEAAARLVRNVDERTFRNEQPLPTILRLSLWIRQREFRGPGIGRR